MHDSKPKLPSGASLLAAVLSIGAGAGYVVIWSLNDGISGCGPPGNSPAARTVDAAPFVLPLAAVVIFLAVGATLRWRPSRLVWGVLIMGVTSGVLQALVFWLEFLGHNCYP